MQEDQEQNSDKKSRGQDDNPFFGYLVFGGLCVIAFIFDVPLAIIIIAIIGYAFSRYSG